ncbi:hypothetical protein BGZ75_007163 [Mortierella antarctica]|nr:hypothetical protein BGZ75_007163 [Mortierella antarctica]
MKLGLDTMGTMLTFMFAPWEAFALQLPFQRPFKDSYRYTPPSPSANLTPYSTAWVQELQLIFNTFGAAANDTSCPTEIPEWSCQPYPLSDSDFIKPTSVWRLRPHDIKAVVSIGDSISAGFAMETARPPFAIVLEYRGKVFSGGADAGDYTLANFLKTYTKHIKGSPSGFTLPLAGGPYHKHKKEWKLATVFIGANNLCAACAGETVPEIADPEEYGAALKSALQELKHSIGPAFVNLVGIFDVTLVYDLSRGHPYCEMLFDTVPVPICGCATANEDDRKRAGELALEYNEVMKRIVKEINEENEHDGTYGVAYQPGLTRFKEGSSKYGQGFMSKLDW